MTRDQHWTVHGSKHVLRDRWISVRADDCTTPQGATVSPYYVLEFPDFVHVFATDDADRVILVRQYRHGLQGVILELPGGVLDPGERDILATGARELREETGFTGGTLEHVTSLSIDPARYANRLHLVRATGVLPGASSPESTEDIEVVLVSREVAKRLALSGDIVNAAHVGMLLVGLAEARYSESQALQGVTMSNPEQQKAAWFTAAELAAACDCPAEKVEALARSNHWPRVHGPAGAKYPIKPEVVRRALAGNPSTVHGSVPLR